MVTEPLGRHRADTQPSPELLATVHHCSSVEETAVCVCVCEHVRVYVCVCACVYVCGCVVLRLKALTLPRSWATQHIITGFPPALRLSVLVLFIG